VCYWSPTKPIVAQIPICATAQLRPQFTAKSNPTALPPRTPDEPPIGLANNQWRLDPGPACESGRQMFRTPMPNKEINDSSPSLSTTRSPPDDRQLSFLRRSFTRAFERRENARQRIRPSPEWERPRCNSRKRHPAGSKRGTRFFLRMIPSIPVPNGKYGGYQAPDRIVPRVEGPRSRKISMRISYLGLKAIVRR